MDEDEGDGNAGCDICGGDNHQTRSCKLLVDGTQVEDTRCPSRASLTVPSNLRVKRTRQHDALKSSCDIGNTASATVTIVTIQARENVAANTRFGPLEAPRRHAEASDPVSAFPLKIFLAGGNSVFLDTSDENRCNWMCLVQAAQSHADHNLIALQLSDNIYFIAKRNIRIHEELRVWYAPKYGRKMGFQEPPWPTSSSSTTPAVESSSGHELRPTRLTRKRKLLMAGLDLQATDSATLPRRTPRRRAAKVWKEYVEDGKEEEEVLQGDVVGTRQEQEEKTTEWTADIADRNKKPRRKNVKSSVDRVKELTKKSDYHQCPFCVRKFASLRVLNKHKILCLYRHKRVTSGGKPAPETEMVMGEQSEVVEAEMACDAEESEPTEEDTCNVIILDEGTGEENRAVLRLLQDGDNIYVTGGESGETNVVNAKMLASGQILMEAMQEIDAPPSYSSSVELTERAVNDDGEAQAAATTVLHSAESTQLISIHHISCDKCEKVFVTEEDLSTHVCPSSTPSEQTEVEATPSTSFVCNLCGQSFLSNCLLRRHLEEASSERHLCPDCGKAHCTEKLFNEHICRRPSPNADGLYCCNICHKTFTKLKYLDKHTPIHTGSNACHICGKWLRSRDSLQNHMRKCGQVRELAQQGAAVCPNCKQEFTDVGQFRRHLYEHSHQFECQKCFARFRNQLTFGCHVCSAGSLTLKCEVAPDDQSSESNVPTGAGVEEREAAAKIRKSPRTPKKIRRDDHDEEEDEGEEEEERVPAKDKNNTAVKDKLQPLECSDCGAFFSSTSSLNVHKRLHGEKQYECDVCSKRFHRKDMLADHCAKHREPTVPCPVCQKRFKTKKSLDVHLLLHDGQKRFECETCGKRFYQRGNLTKHEDVHKASRRHACATCAKEFATKEYLRIHNLEHTSGRRFVCAACTKGFLKEHQLRAHQRTFHTNRIFLCKFCGRHIKLRHSMKRHLLNKHADQQHLWGTAQQISDMFMNTTEVQAQPASQQAIQEGKGHSDEFLLAVPLELPSSSSPQPQASALETDEHDSSNAALTAGGEVLLAVTGIGSEALQQAIESGSARIRPGAAPNTIEISLDIEHSERVESISAFVQSRFDGVDQSEITDNESASTIFLNCSPSENKPPKEDRQDEVPDGDEIPIVDELDLSDGTFVLENGTVLRQGISEDGSNVLFYVLSADEEDQTVTPLDEDDPPPHQ